MKKGLLIFCLVFSISGFAQSKKIIPPNKNLIDSVLRDVKPIPRKKDTLDKNHKIVISNDTNKIDTIFVFLNKNEIIENKKLYKEKGGN